MNRKPLTQTFAATLAVAFLTALIPNQTTAAERNEHKELPAGSGGTLTSKRSSVNGKLNGGGPKVTLRTSGGSIKVTKR